MENRKLFGVNLPKNENIPLIHKDLTPSFSFPFEILFIYIMTGLIVLMFFNAIEIALYSLLAYVALLMFFTIFITMISFTCYNFGKFCYRYIKEN